MSALGEDPHHDRVDTARPDARARVDEMMRRVAQHDAVAFGALYDALGSNVFGIALRVSRNTSMAEEISQETFLQVWRTAHRFDPGKGSAKTWVSTVSHRRAVDAVRHAQASADRDRRSTKHLGPAFDAVAETVQASADRTTVRACLATLTDLQRETVTMAYYGGLSYLEVAERLGVKTATVKTRMRDGLSRLRKCLEPES